eukprot:3731699-Rhodomonas_salina.1
MPVVDLQHCTPLEYLRAHRGVPQQAFIAALSSRPIPFQIETLKLLFDSDLRCGCVTEPDFVTLYENL